MEKGCLEFGSWITTGVWAFQARDPAEQRLGGQKENASGTSGLYMSGSAAC